MARAEGIKYQYARGADGAIVDISSLNPLNRKQNAPFACFGCDSLLIPRLGEQVAWHYAHHRHMRCAPETQLHKLAKQLFVSTYRRCLERSEPFILTLEAPVSCTGANGLEGYECLQNVKRKINFTEYFDTVVVEAQIDNCIADVLLSSSDGKTHLLIEFAVTHKCEPEKIASRKRIVEISLAQESDVEILKQSFQIGRAHV